MSFFLAATWSITAIFALDLIAAIFVSVTSEQRFDLVTRVLCQGVAFLGTLYVLMTIHDRERPLSHALGLRKTSAGLLAVAAVLGVVLQGPLTLVSNLIYGRYPLPQSDIDEMTALFRLPALHQKVAVVVAAGVLGPIVEEAFFRGGILRGLRKKHTARVAVVSVSLLFAAAHRDLRNFVPDLVGGLVMGYVRVASGSLWPPILIHAAFNTTSVIFALQVGPEGEVLTPVQNSAAAVAAVGLVLVFRAIAARSKSAARARLEDAR